MKFIDFHADTLYRLFYQENRELGDLWENSCHVSLEHLRRSGYTAQMFACFLNLAKKPRLGSHYQDVLGMIDFTSRPADMRIKSALQEAFWIMPKIKSRGYCPVS